MAWRDKVKGAFKSPFNRRKVLEDADNSSLHKGSIASVGSAHTTQTTQTVESNLSGNSSMRGNHNDLEFARMNIAVAMVRYSDEDREPETIPAMVPLSHCLLPSREDYKDSTNSYDFSLMFRRVTEDQLNKLYPYKPVSTEYGEFTYFNAEGTEQRDIEDQCQFEAALNNLFHKRHNTEQIFFMFKPESDEARERRLEHAVVDAEAEAEAKATFEAREAAQAIKDKEEDEQIYLDDEAKIDSMFYTTEKREEIANKYKDDDIYAPDPELAAPKKEPEEIARANTDDDVFALDWISDAAADQEPNALTHENKNGIPTAPKTDAKEINSPLTVKSDGVRTDATSPRSPPFSENSSRTGGRRSIMGMSPVALKRPTPKVPVKESPDDRRERFKTLWAEEQRVTYKRSGKGEDEVAQENDNEDGEDGEDGEDEEEADAAVSSEDRAVIKLRELLCMKELSQLGQPPGREVGVPWIECCTMFGLDPLVTGIEERVTIAGLKTKLYQYQIFGVYWQMLNSREVGGGFVADDMGLGKTLSFLAFLVVERQLSVLWDIVNKSRETKDGVHVAEGEMNSGQKCGASRRPGWIACPCDDSSITWGLEAKPGLRMACVSISLVRNWWSQWKTHIDTSVPELALNIIVDHPGAFDDKTTAEDMLSKSSSPRLNTRAGAERFRAKGGKGDDTAKSYQNGMLLLTTEKTYPVWVEKYHTYDGQVRDTVKAGAWKKGKRVGLVFGIVVIDESHEDPFKSVGRMKLLLTLPNGPPFIWGYSGTPLADTPRGIEGILWAIEKRSIKHEVYSTDALDRLCTDFNRFKKTESRDDEGLDRVLTEFKSFLSIYMLRRTPKSTWMGHPLTELNPHIHQDIILRQTSPPYTAKDVADFEERFQSERDTVLAALQKKFDEQPEGRRTSARPTSLTFNVLCRQEWRSRLLATFPMLLRLAQPNADSPLALTDAEVLAMRGSDNKEKDNAYWKNLKSIVEKSPKALWLIEFAQTLLTQTDVNGEDQKLIVVTQFPQVAFILKLFLQRYLPAYKEHIGVVAGRMPLKEKSGIINDFTGKDKGASKRDIKILIGTTRLLGVGLQLTRACNIVLMEPDHQFSHELQAYARVHRIGQRNPTSFSYRLIDGASEIEQRILDRQVNRKESPGKKVEDAE